MATWYVRTSATGGNDANDGTQATQGEGTVGPKLTVAAGMALAVTDGDTVNVGAGSFTETSVPTFAKGVTLQGAGKAATTISVNNANPGYQFNSTTGTAQTIKDCTLTLVTGASTNGMFGVVNAAKPVNVTDCNVTLRALGVETAQRLVYMAGSGDAITFTRCTFAGATASDFFGQDGRTHALNLTDCTGTIATPSGQNFLYHNEGAVTIHGCTLTLSIGGVAFNRAISLDAQAAVTIEDSNLTCNCTNLIKTSAATGEVSISNSTLVMTAAGPIFLTVAGPVTLTNCIFGGSSTTFTTGNTATGTFTMSGGTYNVTNSDGIFVTPSGNLAITGATFMTAGAHYQFIGANVAGATATLTVTDNTITVNPTINPSQNLIDVVTGTYTLEFARNIVTCVSPDWDKRIVSVITQNNCHILDNVIDVRGAALGTAYIIECSDTSAATAMTGCIVSGNLIKYTSQTGVGICVGKDAPSGNGNNLLTDAVVADNILLGPQYWGVAVDGSTTIHAILIGHTLRTTVRNNFVWGGGYGLVVKGDVNTDNTYLGDVVGNTVVDQAVGFANILIKGAKNLWITRNTIYNPSTATASTPCVWLGQNSDGSNSTGIKLSHNIMVGPTKLIDIDASQTITYSNDNVFYSTAATKFSNGATDYTTLADWQAAYDTRSIMQDPGFVDATHGDFRTSDTSDAVELLSDAGPMRTTQRTLAGSQAITTRILPLYSDAGCTVYKLPEGLP